MYTFNIIELFANLYDLVHIKIHYVCNFFAPYILANAYLITQL